jgi:hypothetical protein
MLTSSSSYSRHFYHSFDLSFNNVFYKPLPTPDVTNPVGLHLFYFILLTEFLKYFIFHKIGLNYFLHPSAAPHFKTFNVFLIYFPKCPSYKTTLQTQHFTTFFLKFKSNLLTKRSIYLVSIILNIIKYITMRHVLIFNNYKSHVHCE